MSRILITGGCGMIGSNLTKRLVREGHEVFIIEYLNILPGAIREEKKRAKATHIC